MMAVKVDRLACRIGHDGGSLLEEVGDGLLSSLVAGAAVIDNGNMNQLDPQLGGELLFLNREVMIRRMGQGNDGLDFVVANDSAHRPRLLPGTAEYATGLN